jgi:hypothetical protein
MSEKLSRHECGAEPAARERQEAILLGNYGVRRGLGIRVRPGLKTRMNDKQDLRTDARWCKSFGKQRAEQFRVAQGISFDVGKR